MDEIIKQLISQADLAIKEERFDDLMEFYTEDAVLVIKPGKEAHGKAEIKKAFLKIASYFKNSIIPTQGKMVMLEAGDTVLVISQTLLDAENKTPWNTAWTAEPLMYTVKLEGNGYVQSITPMELP